MNRKNKIYNLLKKKKSVFLVGTSDSGKTYFVLKELIPFLKRKKMAVSYFPDCDRIRTSPKGRVVIVDEVETFQDKEFLEKRSTEKPHYSKKYLQKVARWFRVLKKIQTPAIFIVTRSMRDEVLHLQKILKTTDWDNRKVQTVVFSRRTPKNEKDIISIK
ncbi:MAG: hypothetical protein NUW02_00525 [Candidatus Campbellbacteria bacterium]|nr:hypothetical protein [Candidatus Campbellbacteria bacterium]